LKGESKTIPAKSLQSRRRELISPKTMKEQEKFLFQEEVFCVTTNPLGLFLKQTKKLEDSPLKDLLY